MVYPVAIAGSGLIAEAAFRACRRSGFQEIERFHLPQTLQLPAASFGANLTRILKALHFTELQEHGHAPDRAQVRLARSAYLVAELPLGRFTSERYGSELLNLELDAFAVDNNFDPPPTEATLENNFGAVLFCSDRHVCSDQHAEEAGGINVFHAAIPHLNPAANITWTGRHRIAFQFSTPARTHVYFCVTTGQLDKEDWHGLLHEAVDAATLLTTTRTRNPKADWYAGHFAYLGEGAYAPSLLRPDLHFLGLEDIWVLSRMMENYEEDVADALAEYEKFRKPRAGRVVQLCNEDRRKLFESSTGQAFFHHLGTALSTRFLPEIAMQKLDWVYGYDCIKGFH